MVSLLQTKETIHKLNIKRLLMVSGLGLNKIGEAHRPRPIVKYVGLPTHLTEFLVINQFMDGRIFTTHWAIAILAEFEFVEFHR